MAQMITFKCKICGGNLTVSPGEYIAECEYCGTTMTIPNIDSERKARIRSVRNDQDLKRKI